MVDIRFTDIHVDDSIAFILNKRGEKPRLIHGYVKELNSASILVLDDNGEFHLLRHSRRSHLDGRYISAVVLRPQFDKTGSVVDCAGHPIASGDNVAFMEVPSQGFSTSLIIGEVLRVEDSGLTIVVRASKTQKYMRTPGEVAVID